MTPLEQRRLFECWNPGREPDAEVYGTLFWALPQEMIRSAADWPGFCSCKYCEGTKPGDWDTMAMDRRTGAKWSVHFPELQVLAANRT